MNHPSTTTKIHVEFASVLKQLARSPEGVPVLRLRVSGTKMDRTAYVHDSGVEVVGEKIVPELLATMWQEAKAGRVYLLENHSATMPMGWSAEADLKDLGDGNQELYVDFVLDMDVSPARDLVHILEARPDYEPQCSVGLMVMREIAWDEEEGGYVGRLTEGRFEHVAMTRPDHAAYPDADVEEIFLSDSLVEAAKSLAMTTATAIIKAQTLDPNAASTKGADMKVRVASGSPEEESGSGVKVRESVEKAAVEVAKEAAAEAIATLKEAEAEDNKEADADAEAKKEDSADAEAAMEKEEMSKEDTMKGLAEHCRSLGKSIAKAKEEGASPDDIKALMDDLQADYEALCQMLEAAGVDMGEKDADAPAADEDEPPAKGEEDKEDGAPPPADDDDDEKAPPPKAPAKKGDEPVMKTKAPKKPEPTEDERIMALVTKAIGSKLDEINKRLEHFDDLTPATPLPKRYNANEADAEEGSEMDRIEKMVRGIKDPKDRELITKSLAESLVTGHFTRSSN